MKSNSDSPGALQVAAQDNVKNTQGFIDAARQKAHEDPAGVDVAKTVAELAKLEVDLVTDYPKLESCVAADFIRLAEYANDMKKVGCA